MKKLFILSVIVLCTVFVYSQNNRHLDEANILYGFGRLLSWPSYPDNILTINVYGESPVTDYINNISAKNSNKARNTVASETNNPNISGCNILFIPDDVFSEYSVISPYLQGKSILVVSDSKGSLSQGVDVEISYKKTSDQDSILSYKINISSIKNKNIKISPEFVGYSIIE